MTADMCPLEVWARAREAAANAVSSGPDIAESQTARGMVSYWLDWDWSAAQTLQEGCRWIPIARSSTDC